MYVYIYIIYIDILYINTIYSISYSNSFFFLFFLFFRFLNISVRSFFGRLTCGKLIKLRNFRSGRLSIALDNTVWNGQRLGHTDPHGALGGAFERLHRLIQRRVLQGDIVDE